MKSAYKVHCDDSLRASWRGPASNSSNEISTDNNVGEIWKLNCANRIKHFLWRMAHNSLALFCNLKRRGMDVDTCCFVCRRLDEDGGHPFFKCKYVKQVWCEMNLNETWERLASYGSAKEVAEHILRLDSEQQLKVLFLLNNWWRERNRIREGERKRVRWEVAAITARQADEIQRIHGTSRAEEAEVAAASTRNSKD